MDRTYLPMVQGMKYTQTELSATHEEILKWVEWFLLEQTRRGLPKDQKDQAGFIIMAFLDSGEHYLKTKDMAIKNCPACQGRGHSNLFVIGAKEPSKCGTCGGSGIMLTEKVND